MCGELHIFYVCVKIALVAPHLEEEKVKRRTSYAKDLEEGRFGVWMQDRKVVCILVRVGGVFQRFAGFKQDGSLLLEPIEDKAFTPHSLVYIGEGTDVFNTALGAPQREGAELPKAVA